MKGKKLIFSGRNTEIWYSEKTKFYYYYELGKLVAKNKTGKF